MGGRFLIAQVAFTDAMGTVLSARDQKTQRRVALRVFSPQLLKGDALPLLREICRSASELSHPNVISTYGMGPDGFGGAFVASSWVEGATLARVVKEQAAAGESISAGGIATVISAVAAGLEAAHEKLYHGALRPASVWVGGEGIIRIGGFGMDRAMLQTAGLGLFDEPERACFAPEIKGGAAPSAASDIFGLGSILYALLTGRFPGSDFVDPSQIRPEIPTEVDSLLLECLALDPEQRPKSPSDVSQRLQNLLAGAHRAPFIDDFGIAVTLAPELDRKTPPPPERPSGPRGAPRAGSRVSIHEHFRPSLGEGETTSAIIRLDDAVARVTEDDTPRWMVVKDGLDFGPWSGRELAKRVIKGKVIGENGLLNMDTGEKMRIEEHPEFQGFVDEFRLRDAEAKEVAAVARGQKVERRSNRAKLGAGMLALGVIALGLVIYFTTRDTADSEEVAQADLITLYESGHADEIEGSAGILPDPPRRRGRGGGTGMGGSRSAGGNLTYEEAMNQVMEMGDVTMSSGEARLTPQQVAGVMNRNMGRLFGCVGQEGGSGGRLTRVQIDLAIAGTGELIGASTRQGSPRFQSCIQSRTRGIRFPTFSAPRMGARFSFSAE